MSDLDMLKILKGFDTVEKKSVIKESKITECGPMTQESAPNVNISVTGNSMADIMRALANIEQQPASPMAIAMDDMEAQHDEEVAVNEEVDTTAIMGQIRKMAKSVEQSPDERAHRIFAQEVEPSLIELFQHYDQQMDTKKKEAVRGLIRQNKAAQKQTDTRNANNIAEVLYGLMRGTDESFANEPDEDYQDHEYMTKTLSGGLNREKKMYSPAAAGDNPMAVESIKERLYRALNEKKAKPDFLDMDKDGNKKEPMKKALKDKKVKEAAKPDFLDMDKDGNKKEPMKKAVADKKKKGPVKEAELSEIDANTMAGLALLKMKHDAEKKYKDSVMKGKERKPSMADLAGRFDQETIAGLTRLKMKHDAEKKYRDSFKKK